MAFELIEARSADLGSPARAAPAEREPLVVGVVQVAWDPDPAGHAATIADGVRLACERGAQVVCLPELTLSPYFAVNPELARKAARFAESVQDGPTVRLARELAAETHATIHASLHEAAEDGGLGYNTAICVAPDGRLLARTRKLHIPCFPGYHEDLCFRPGDGGTPVVEIAGARFGFPTCWDQWFPELARVYSLDGAEVLVYPTAIGAELHLDGFDTEPLWRQMICANGLANATFMVAVNRIGTEQGLQFYGSSFVSDPYGRVVARAPGDAPAVLVVTLDLDQRRDWLSFGLLSTRRPEVYRPLAEVPS
ncbi:MAG: nitrilase-related carbon-nitrogen hydrolase [Solirubrobacteraceae bacterium]